MNNFNLPPGQFQGAMHVSSNGNMIMQSPTVGATGYSLSSQSSLNMVGVGGQMYQGLPGVYLRQGQITSSNIIMRSPAPSPSPGVLLRSPVPYLTPSSSPSVPPSPSPSPNHSPYGAIQAQTLYVSGGDSTTPLAPVATLVGSNNFPLSMHSHMTSSAQPQNSGKKSKKLAVKPSFRGKETIIAGHKQVYNTHITSPMRSPNASVPLNMTPSPKHTYKGGSQRTPVPSPQGLLNPIASPSASPGPHSSKSPITSPGPTQQVMQQGFQQIPVMGTGNQLVQIIQGSQIINQRQPQVIVSTSTPQHHFTTTLGGKQKHPQQILPKPAGAGASNVCSSGQGVKGVKTQPQSSQQGQIILPGNINTQSLLLNQMPVLVQQNTPQGVQLILRPPAPPSAPGLLIHNTRPQMQQPQQQLLRILNANGMQIAAPTFIVSSQQNLQQNLNLQQNMQQNNLTQGALKNSHTTNLHLSNHHHLHQTVVSQPQRQISLNNNLLGQSMAHINNPSLAQIPGLQLNGNLAHIQIPNGLNGQFISQMPAQFQTGITGFNHLNSSTTNINQMSTNVNNLSTSVNQIQQSNLTRISDISNVASTQNLLTNTVVPLSSSHNHMKLNEPLTVQKDSHPMEESNLHLPNDIGDKSPAKPKRPKKIRKAKGKLDLANLMKLSGIMEDDDLHFLESSDVDTSVTEYASTSESNVPVSNPVESHHQQESPLLMHLQKPAVSCADVPLMISIPTSTSTDNAYSFSIPSTVDNGTDITKCQNNNGTIISKNSMFSAYLQRSTSAIKTDKSEGVPYMITIQNSIDGNAQPYTISIPNVGQGMDSAGKMNIPISITGNISNQAPNNTRVAFGFSPTVTNSLQSSEHSLAVPENSGMCVPSFVNNVLNSTIMTPTLQSQINEIQNQLMGVSPTKSLYTKRKSTKKPTKKLEKGEIPTCTANTLKHSSSQTTGLTPIITGSAVGNSPLLNVPSQIGNIQISQVDVPVSEKNGQNILNRSVDNHIQIMPIIETSVPNTESLNQNINCTNVPHSLSTTASTSNFTQNMSSYNVTQHSVNNINVARNLHHNQHVGSVISNNLPEPSVIGGLSLSLSEDGRIILRHDTNAPAQDIQSQLFLQSLLGNAIGVCTSENVQMKVNPIYNTQAHTMPIVEHIDKTDGMKQKPVTNCVNTVTPIATPKVFSKRNMESQKNQNVNFQNINVMCNNNPSMSPIQKPNIRMVDNDIQGKSATISQQISGHQNINQFKHSEQMEKPSEAMTKFVDLPRIGQNQQLFSLNTATNQIVQLSPSLTTAALGPTEQLLIVPTGINAQQLAQCLLQGQIHFNNISGMPSTSTPVSSNNLAQAPQPMLNLQQSLHQQSLRNSQTVTMDNAKPMQQIKDQSPIEKIKKKKKCKFNDASKTKQTTNVKAVLQEHISGKHVHMVDTHHNQIPTTSIKSHSISPTSYSSGNQCHMHSNTQVPPLINVSTKNYSNKVLDESNLPQLVPIPQTSNAEQAPQNFLQRVQTIQLTPQKQQMLKNVQAQIQTLSAKLQNKNSLASLSIPTLDGSVPAGSGPVPNLSHNDSEIHAALQRLFMEQQKILATGKIIPTIPGQHANFQVNASSSGQMSIAATNTSIAVSSMSITLNNQNPQITTQVSVMQPETSSSALCSTKIPNSPTCTNKGSSGVSVPSCHPSLAVSSQVQQLPSTSSPAATSAATNSRPAKPTINRSSLFEQQLTVDQSGAINPDIRTPFLSKADACKRLIRYHCLNGPIEKEPEGSNEMFELTGRHFLNKYQGMIHKYQHLLMKESMRSVQTSELMMIDRMFVADEKSQLEKLRHESSEESSACMKQFDDLIEGSNIETESRCVFHDNKADIVYAELESDANLNCDNVKNDKPEANIKYEQLEESKTTQLFLQLCNTPSRYSNNSPKQEANMNFSYSSSTLTNQQEYRNSTKIISTNKSAIFNSPEHKSNISVVKSERGAEYDIESEITPSFIMRNCESNSKTALSKLRVSVTTKEDDPGNIDFFTAITPKSNHKEEIKLENVKCEAKTEPYDEWLCIQKELGYVTEDKLAVRINRKTDQAKTVENQLQEIFNQHEDSSDNPLVDSIFNDSCAKIPLADSSLGSLFIPEKIIDSKSVENRLEDIFGEEQKHFETESSSVETRLEELFHGSADSDNIDAETKVGDFKTQATINALAVSPKRPWNGECEHVRPWLDSKRHCPISDDHRRLWAEHNSTNSDKRTWNGEPTEYKTTSRSDVAVSIPKPRKNILNELERDLLGLEHFDNTLNTSLGSNFDEDINAQVQSAIDSILNLQSGTDSAPVFQDLSSSSLSPYIMEHLSVVPEIPKRSQKVRQKLPEMDLAQESSPDIGLDEAVKSILTS